MVHQREETNNKKRYITFMVLPHNSSRNIVRINMPYWLVVILSTVLALIFISIASFFIYSTNITARLIHYYGIQSENKRQSKQLKVFIEKIKDLETGVRELEERDQELREMLGLQKKSKEKFNTQSSIDNVDDATQHIALLEDYITKRKKDYSFLKDISVALRYKFDSLPSIWPTDGTVLCVYGWRIHPFTGRQEFHKGIDIPSWIGHPIKAAGDGIVVFTGWSRGYGNAVIIDHKNGYSTLYGHISKIMVNRWEKVSKGQVIAKVGDTGLATGPHLHYEVQYKESAINPVNFLELNIRSANNF